MVGTIFYGLALTGLAALPAIKGTRPYILITQLHAGMASSKSDELAKIGHAVWVSILYAAPPLVAAWELFRRRGVAS